MSYLHCPSCRCAYHLERHAACPTCGVQPGAPADPTLAIVAAAEQLARAINAATPAQLAAAEVRLQPARALPAPAPPRLAARVIDARPPPRLRQLVERMALTLASRVARRVQRALAA